MAQSRSSDSLRFATLNPDFQIQEVVDILQASALFRAHGRHQTPRALTIQSLQYAGPSGQAGAIKISIDFHLPVLQPVLSRTYANVWGLPITMPTMDAVELCAETLLRAIRRARYRDFYDVYLLATEAQIVITDALALLPRKDNLYILMRQDLPASWQLAKERQWRDLQSIWCANMIASERIEALIHSLSLPIT